MVLCNVQLSFHFRELQHLLLDLWKIHYLFLFIYLSCGLVDDNYHVWVFLAYLMLWMSSAPTFYLHHRDMQMGRCIVFPVHEICVTHKPLCSGCHFVGGDGLHLTTHLQMIQSSIQARQKQRLCSEELHLVSGSDFLTKRSSKIQSYEYYCLVV